MCMLGLKSEGEVRHDCTRHDYKGRGQTFQRYITENIYGTVLLKKYDFNFTYCTKLEKKNKINIPLAKI